VYVRGPDIDQYKGEKGFDHIADALDILYPAKVQAVEHVAAPDRPRH
jgi:hypothetical protein